jgi:hypothetical protein
MSDEFQPGYLESIGASLAPSVATSGRGTPIDNISLASTSGNSGIGQFFVSLGNAANSVLSAPAVQSIVNSALVKQPTANAPKATPPATATGGMSTTAKWLLFGGAAIVATILIVKIVRR